MRAFGAVPRNMKALGACVLAFFAATLAAQVEAGRACSCALPDPRAALAQADGAFVGTLVSRREGDQTTVLTYSVEKALKGAITRTIEVSTASNSAACGIEAPVGTRVGLVLERRAGAWYGHLCWQFAPEELLAAGQPLPAPNGHGPVALIVGGGFGESRLIALDGRGRTLAYGMGTGRVGLLAVCPGGRLVAELAFAGSGQRLVVRATRTLRVLRRQTLTLPRGRYPQRLACEDEAGTSLLVFGRGTFDSYARSALYRAKDGRLQALWNGAAYDAAFAFRLAFLSAGTNGRTLLRVDLRTGRTQQLARLPGAVTAMAVNDAGTVLAGMLDPEVGQSHVVRVDLTGRPARVTSTRLAGEDGSGQIFWLGSGRLLFVPAYGQMARVLDDSLRTRSRFRWTAAAAALVGSEVFGTDISVALFRATLPSGPQRVIRRLPGRPTVIVSATG
jgi:hypothetical protein